MAEYFLVPKENLAGDTLLLPEALSFADGSLVEPTACAVKSLRRSRLQPGERVFVIGLGIMGQLHVALARHLGAENILATDFVPYRREKALQFGANIVLDPAERAIEEAVKEHTDGEMAEVVIVGPGSIEAMELGIRCAARGGTVVLFTTSMPDTVLHVLPYHLYFNEISLVPSYSCGPNDTREALRLIRDGVVTAEKFVTHRFPFAALHDAYKNAAAAHNSIKTVVEFS
jgi:L-iditol 2-dehydrogenase